MKNTNPMNSNAEIEINKNTISKSEYSQNWQAYNAAQTREVELFMELLADICSFVHNPDYNKGRPTLPLSEMVFSSALKVYSGFSLRRFVGFMKIAKEKGYINNVCSYSTVSNYMRKPELTVLFHKLIRMSGLPLRSVKSSIENLRTMKRDEYLEIPEHKQQVLLLKELKQEIEKILKDLEIK